VFLSLYAALGIALHAWTQHCPPWGPGLLVHGKPHSHSCPQPQPALRLRREPRLGVLACPWSML